MVAVLTIKYWDAYGGAIVRHLTDFISPSCLSPKNLLRLLLPSSNFPPLSDITHLGAASLLLSQCRSLLQVAARVLEIHSSLHNHATVCDFKMCLLRVTHNHGIEGVAAIMK